MEEEEIFHPDLTGECRSLRATPKSKWETYLTLIPGRLLGNRGVLDVLRGSIHIRDDHTEGNAENKSQGGGWRIVVRKRNVALCAADDVYMKHS